MVSVPSDEPVSSAWFLNIGKPQNLAFGMLIISINTLLKFSSSPKALNDILNTYYQSQSIRWIPDVYTSNCLHELSLSILKLILFEENIIDITTAKDKALLIFNRSLLENKKQF